MKQVNDVVTEDGSVDSYDRSVNNKEQISKSKISSNT